MRSALDDTDAPPPRAADATWVPLRYRRWVVPSYVATTWYADPATTAPAGAWSRRRAPFCMTVNSSLGPLNWMLYASALVTTDANAPAAGRLAGRIHASSDRLDPNDREAEEGMAR